MASQVQPLEKRSSLMRLDETEPLKASAYPEPVGLAFQVVDQSVWSITCNEQANVRR